MNRDGAEALLPRWKEIPDQQRAAGRGRFCSLAHHGGDELDGAAEEIGGTGSGETPRSRPARNRVEG